MKRGTNQRGTRSAERGAPEGLRAACVRRSALRVPRSALILLLALAFPTLVVAQQQKEITPESRAALDRGLEWLALNQGTEGNWGSNDLGLVSMGLLAFLADGHTPGRGKYGPVVEKALNFILKNAKPSVLLNIVDRKRDLY